MNAQPATLSTLGSSAGAERSWNWGLIFALLLCVLFWCAVAAVSLVVL
jgi:hypothetical protein